MLTLVMPMAGRGSRFSILGYSEPKPLIQLDKKPFFWWATESIINSTSEEISLIYVILQEHADKYALDKKILNYYPSASVIKIPNVTSGALETAMIAVAEAEIAAPIIINDCDQFFEAKKLDFFIKDLKTGILDGFLCNFHSELGCYSYAKYTADGVLEATAEKNKISKNAIAGAYGFSSPNFLNSFYSKYKNECSYDELFISGVFNLMVRSGGLIRGLDLDRHISFGTPEEYLLAKKVVGRIKC